MNINEFLEKHRRPINERRIKRDELLKLKKLVKKLFNDTIKHEFQEKFWDEIQKDDALSKVFWRKETQYAAEDIWNKVMEDGLANSWNIFDKDIGNVDDD